MLVYQVITCLKQLHSIHSSKYIYEVLPEGKPNYADCKVLYLPTTLDVKKGEIYLRKQTRFFKIRNKD